MFCRNCGSEINEGAAVCVSCGVPVGRGKKYCQNCGAETAEEAVLCTACGSALTNPSVMDTITSNANGQKSKIAAGLLALFCGSFGVHNFYLGYTKKGVIQLLITLLLCWTFIAPMAVGIWALVEAILIFTDKISTDAKGIPLS